MMRTDCCRGHRLQVLCAGALTAVAAEAALLARIAGDEIAHLRIHPGAPAAAAEDPVMAGAVDGDVCPMRFRHAGAQRVRGARLAEAGDVVELALDGQDGGIADRRRRHPFAAHVPLPARQQVLLEQSRLFLTHGHLFSPDNLPALAAGDVLVYGHTHIPVAEKRGEIYHFNPGSVSIPKGGYPASYGMLDGNTLRVIALNDQQVIAQVAINP